jgi:TPP-dependent pyruvate/acetoin dehydrogenase alpha subunit
MAEVLEKKVTTDKKVVAPKYDKATYMKWLEVMYRVRRFEEKGLFAYSQQKIIALPTAQKVLVL